MQGRGRSGSFSVIERGPDDESAVVFGSNDATALEDQRDEEELRRLLYVACTRARDRLYLAAELDARGQVRRGARSLGNLLPATLLTAFAQVAATPEADRIDWNSPQGLFTFRACRPVEISPASQPELLDARTPLDISWLTPDRRPPVAASAGVTADTSVVGSRKVDRKPKRSKTDPRDRFVPSEHERLVGTLVHRLFQHSADAAAGRKAIARQAEALLRLDERVDIADLVAATEAAAELFGRLRTNPEVLAALASGQVLYEVPFSFAPSDESGTLIRGVIDCLVVPVDGPPLVLEFKTGGARSEHPAQVERYLAAVRAFLADNRVETKILYA
jgi:ATP-dependent exoDNAse (exonuclease V) beta subunit